MFDIGATYKYLSCTFLMGCGWLALLKAIIRHSPVCKHRLEFTVNFVIIVTITILSLLTLGKIIFFHLWNSLSVKKQQTIMGFFSL